MCPHCRSNALRYEAFEDMYWCEGCGLCLYPEEVGGATNLDAPIFHVGGSGA